MTSQQHPINRVPQHIEKSATPPKRTLSPADVTPPTVNFLSLSAVITGASRRLLINTAKYGHLMQSYDSPGTVRGEHWPCNINLLLLES